MRINKNCKYLLFTAILFLLKIVTPALAQTTTLRTDLSQHWSNPITNGQKAFTNRYAQVGYVTVTLSTQTPLVVIEGNTLTLTSSFQGTTQQIASVTLDFSREVEMLTFSYEVVTTGASIFEIETNPAGIRRVSGGRDVYAIQNPGTSVDIRLPIVANNITPFAGQNNTIKLSIDYLDLDVGANQFDYTVNAPSWQVTPVRPLQYGRSSTLQLTTTIRDTDTGLLHWDFTTDNNFNQITQEYQDWTASGNEIMISALAEFKGIINGPPTTTITIGSPNDITKSNQQVTVNIEGTHAPGYVWDGMLMWFKADNGIVIDQNQEVEKWIDYSGNGRDMIATNTHRPSYNRQADDKAINYSPTLSFSNDDFFTAMSGGLVLDERSYPNLQVFAVYKPVGANAGDVWGISDGIGNDRGLYEGGKVGGASTDFNVSALYQNKPVLTSIAYQRGGNSVIRQNGTQVETFTAKITTDTSQPLQIGNSGNSNQSFQGEIAELIFYNRILTEEETQRIETSLAIKYGLSLPYNYLNAQGNPLLTDVNNYRNNLLGICNDDAVGITKNKAINIDEGILEIEATEVLNKNAYVLLGNNNQQMAFVHQGVPEEYNRLERLWHVSMTGQAQLTTTLKFHLSGVTAFDLSTIARWRLLVDDTDVDFTNAKVYSLDKQLTSSGDATLTFNGITLSDGNKIALATEIYTIQGTAYFDRGNTPLGIGRTFTLVINGVETQTTTTNAMGEFQFRLPNFQQQDNIAILSKDNALKGVTMASLPQSRSYDNIDFFTDNLVLKSFETHPIENSDLTQSTTNSLVNRYVRVDQNTEKLFTYEGVSLYIPSQVVYQPASNITIDGDIVIEGTFIADQGNARERYELKGNWIVENMGVFEAANASVVMNGADQSVLGSTVFYQFEKETTTAATLFFEEASTQMFVQNLILKGGDAQNKLNIRAIDDKGSIVFGKPAFIKPLFTRVQGDGKDTWAYLDVRDNTNLGDFIINPYESMDSGTSINWFSPTVTFQNTLSSVQERNVTHRVAVVLNTLSTREVVVPFAITTASTANADDYNFSGKIVTFPATDPNAPNADDRIRYIDVMIRQDDVFELDETITLELLENGLRNARLTTERAHEIIILNDDPPPAVNLTISETLLGEKPSSGAIKTNVEAHIPVQAEVDIIVQLSFSEAAVIGSDYEVSSNVLVIAAGTTMASTELTVLDDDIYELPELLTIDIESVKQGAENGLQRVFATIISDDIEPDITLGLDIKTIKEGENFAKVWIESTQVSESDVLATLVDLGNADKNNDYTLSSQQFVIPAGFKNSNIILLEPIDDNEIEFNEYVTLTISNVRNAQVKTRQQNTVVIQDNEADLQNIKISASPSSILGDGFTTTDILVQLFDSEQKPVTISGGAMVISSRIGAISTTRDLGNGFYVATLTSIPVLGTSPMYAIVSATLESERIANTTTVTIRPAQDSDGDGILDFCECPVLGACLDSDGDGTPNYLDLDSDDDGIPDRRECVNPGANCGTCKDSDNDGVPDYIESNKNDFDQDGMPNALDFDSDNDGKNDGLECGEQGMCPDEDNDGIPDWDDADDKPIDPNGGDSDQDGTPDKIECPTGYPCPDTDQDGIPNYFKDDGDENDCVNGICPDCDGDGIANVFDLDDDNNGIVDVVEIVLAGGNKDIDSDGLLSLCDPDDDGDGIPDQIECPDPNNCADTDSDNLRDFVDVDSDNDGILDKNECGGTSPCFDSDFDGIPDYLDFDSDNDGIPDERECTLSVDGFCPDDDGDGLPNNRDTDSNNNGIVDGSENFVDCDNDGLEAFRDTLELCPELIPTSGFFSPNGDGINDFWYIENIEKFGHNKVTIYNRLGSIVFQVENYNNNIPEKRFGVDTATGINLSSNAIIAGTYYFKIEINELDPLQGYLYVQKR